MRRVSACAGVREVYLDSLQIVIDESNIEVGVDVIYVFLLLAGEFWPFILFGGLLSIFF